MNNLSRRSELEATQHTVRFFETLLRASTDGVVITDTTQNIIVTNEAFCSFFNQQRQDVIETSLFSCLEMLEGDAARKWVDFDHQVRIEGQARDIEFRTSADSGDRYLSVNASRLDRIGNEEVGVVISIWRDVTSHKEAEARVIRLNTELGQQLATVKALNQELESFTYTVSHDLRSPLRHLDGFSHILARDYPDRLDERGRHHLERIRANALRMSQLIDDLLQLSRLTRGELDLALVDLSDLAREQLLDLQHNDAQRQAEIHVDNGMRVVGDHHLLRSLVENLLGNAWKYTSNNDVARIRFTVERVEGEQIFTIQDNGVGFNMDYADKLFAPFQRLHGEAEFEGSGIGLATVQRIIQRHGGRIWAEATPGQGADFHFTLGHNHLPDSDKEYCN